MLKPLRHRYVASLTVFNHRDLLPVVGREDVVEERGFAAAQEASQDGDRHQALVRRALTRSHGDCSAFSLFFLRAADGVLSALR